MLQSIEEIVYGPLLAVVAVAVIVFEGVVLAVAARRQRRGRPPLSLAVHAIAGVAVLPLPVLIGVSVHAARAMMLAVYLHAAGDDPGENAAAISRGMAGQLNAIPFGITVTGLALLFWFIGLAYTLSAPRADGRAHAFPPAALVAAGLLPTAFGALQWCIDIIRTSARMAGTPPDTKVALVAQALDGAHVMFARTARISALAIPLLAVAAMVLIVLRDRTRAGAAAPPRPRSARPLLAASAAALILAALLVVEARPMAAENGLPWPAPSLSSQLLVFDPPTPDLTGPDPIERAPVVQLFPARIALDTAPVSDFESLQDKLDTLRVNFNLLHTSSLYEPSADFNEMAVIIADPATPIPRLAAALNAVRGAEYFKPLFAFTKPEVMVRPVLGKLQRARATGARVKLAFVFEDDEIGPDTAQVWLGSFADYGAFARRVVALRNAGKSVVVYVNRPPR